MSTTVAFAHPSAFGVATFELGESEVESESDATDNATVRNFVYTLRIPSGAFGALEIRPSLPGGCVTESARRVPDSGAVVLTWTGRCEFALEQALDTERALDTEQVLVGLGLVALPPDFTVHLQVIGALEARLSLSTEAPHLRSAANESAITHGYFAFGVEHIAFGYDHLLFVLGLLLLVGRAHVQRVLTVVTAFTLGHSVSLSYAALSAPAVNMHLVEIFIALSVVHLAREILRPRPSLTRRHPAIIAASFGLIHGLGFASALTEAGLPSDGRILALLKFNLGVEFGQLVAVLLMAGAMLLLTRALSQVHSIEKRIHSAFAYFVGVGGMVALLSLLFP